MFCCLARDQEMSASYWPTSGLLEVGSLTIELDKETLFKGYTIRTFTVTSEVNLQTQMKSKNVF